MSLDDSELVRLHDEGLSWRQIAARFGVQHGAISRRLHALGVKPAHARTVSSAEQRTEALRLYESGLSSTEAARRSGCAIKTVLSMVHAAGIKPRGVDKDVDMARLREMYERGVSVLAMSRALGVDRAGICRRLRRLGLTVRGASESNVIRMAREGADGRSRLTAAAHAAVRGKPLQMDDKRRKALARQRVARMSAIEKTFAAAFDRAGVRVVPQMAFDIFNIDFALPERRIAIEIDPGQWHSRPAKRAFDVRKDAALHAAGWRVVRWTGNSIRTRNPDLPEVADAFVAELTKLLAEPDRRALGE